MNLRNGYTTGSCLAAGAVAAWRSLTAAERPDRVELLLPSGALLEIPVAQVSGGCAVVIKDGGDDPDVTTGHAVVTRLAWDDGVPGARDYLESAGGGEIVVTSTCGVGVATRPGLAVPPGKWAINPGPRRMLAANLARAGFNAGRLKVTVDVPDGMALAGATLNPQLGIEGGISILGNSGIVRPYSHSAYAATVALQLRSLGFSGVTTAAAVTGNRTAEAVRRDYPALPEEAVVRIGDFIKVAAHAASQAGLSRLIVGCMPGKLFKYACGEVNTHAHQSAMLLERLREFSAVLPPELKLSDFSGMGELAAFLSPECYLRLLRDLMCRAQTVLSGWSGSTAVEIALYDEKKVRIL